MIRWLMLAAAGVLIACGEDSAANTPTPQSSVATAPRTATAEQGGGAPPVSPPLLPDLRVSEPHELYIQLGEDGIREIRFSTTIANMGDGPLEMIGSFDEASGAVSTIQRIHREDGTINERDVGRFVFDDGHDHWHLEDFIVFELLSVTDDGQPGEVLATTGKMTFCLADSHPVADPPVNAAPKAGVTSCDQEIQGISVGWEDIYLAALPGQELDIPDLPDGRYAIRSKVDPDGLLLETNDNNNETLSFVDVEGSVIAYVPGG